ncbi:MAG: hypothetical protein JW850_19195 [Thermoflexales bacterium]|nr:hypothetical protein [Thermoflexales bacterium]
MNEIDSYLAEIQLALVNSPIIAEYHIVRSWINTDDGYVRIRATLTNGDFVEAAEYFALHADHVVTVDYRHQWMADDKVTLRRRWDNTPDHPELDNFPHHFHVSNEETVFCGQAMSLVNLLRVIESELENPHD